MDANKLSEVIAKISEYLENTVEEGIPVVRYRDESMDADGIKIDSNLIVQEIDGDFMLERITEIPATRFDPADTYYEELATVGTIEELLGALTIALEENEEEKAALAWLSYENEIEEVEEDEDDQ